MKELIKAQTNVLYHQKLRFNTPKGDLVADEDPVPALPTTLKVAGPGSVVSMLALWLKSHGQEVGPAPEEKRTERAPPPVMAVPSQPKSTPAKSMVPPPSRTVAAAPPPRMAQPTRSEAPTSSYSGYGPTYVNGRSDPGWLAEESRPKTSSISSGNYGSYANGRGGDTFVPFYGSSAGNGTKRYPSPTGPTYTNRATPTIRTGGGYGPGGGPLLPRGPSMSTGGVGPGAFQPLPGLEQRHLEVLENLAQEQELQAAIQASQATFEADEEAQLRWALEESARLAEAEKQSAAADKDVMDAEEIRQFYEESRKVAEERRRKAEQGALYTGLGDSDEDGYAWDSDAEEAAEASDVRKAEQGKSKGPAPKPIPDEDDDDDEELPALELVPREE